MSAADVNSTQLVSAGAVGVDDTDNVQLNGVMMNGHDDRPSFRLMLLLAGSASQPLFSAFVSRYNAGFVRIFLLPDIKGDSSTSFRDLAGGAVLGCSSVLQKIASRRHLCCLGDA